MQKCTKCGMPDTRPGSKFRFGICGACWHYEGRQYQDWGAKREELREMVSGKRILVAISGGKDSHWIIKQLLMFPVLGIDTITVHDCFTASQAGLHNLANLKAWIPTTHQHWDWYPDRQKFIEHTRRDFEATGEPLKWIEKMIYKIPMDYAIAHDYSYVVFGEDSSREYGGKNTVEDIDVLYMSHYFPWDDIEHVETATEMGFQGLMYFDDWKRQHHLDDYSQIDSIGYPVHLWLKYPKFGFQRVTDIATRRVRAGHWMWKQAQKVIEEHDEYIDPQALVDFCNTLGYTQDEFWKIVMNADWNKYYKQE